MEITINVDESKFGEVLQKELEALTKEEIVSLIKDGMRQLLVGDLSKTYEQSVLLKYFIEKNSYSNFYGSNWRPTSILEGLIKSTTENKELWQDLVKDIQDDVIETLKSNYKDIIMNTFIKMLTDTISSKVVGSSEFQTNISMMMNENIYNHIENHHNK